jgi:hypothetical protein
MALNIGIEWLFYRKNRDGDDMGELIDLLKTKKSAEKGHSINWFS